MFSRILPWRAVPLSCGIGFIATSLFMAWSYLSTYDTPTLRMSAGSESSRRHAVAQYLCEQASQHELSMSLLETAGTEDCLNRIKAGQLDVAIVSNGVKVPNDEDITVLGVLQLEAVHVLVRPGFPDEVPLSKAIRGKRVNLGERGSTEWLLAHEFLTFARLQLPTATNPGDVVPTEFGKKYLTEQCMAIMQAEAAEKERLIAKLPDCLLILDTLPCYVAQLLIESAGYQIKPLPATRAFLLDQLQDRRTSKTIVEREFLEATQIPACSYFTTQVYPESDCETVGVRLLVVAHRKVPDRAIQPLMKTLFEGEFSHRIQPQSPRELVAPYAIHTSALAYFDRDKPMIAMQQAMEWLSSGLSFLGAFSAGALSFYSLIRKKRLRTPSYYLAEIRKIGLARIEGESDLRGSVRSSPIAKHYDDQLLKLRQDMLEDVCEGRIKGDQSFFNILLLLKETRQELSNRDREPVEAAKQVLRRRQPTEQAA